MKEKSKMQLITAFTKKCGKMPINYRTFSGIECKTFYTNRSALQDAVFLIGSDNTIEINYRTLENSPLREAGFQNMVIYIEKSSGRAIAILGV